VSEADTELRGMMLAYQRGSLDGFQAVYALLAPELLRYLRHLLRGSEGAEDLLQETFLQMHRSRSAYNPAYAMKPWAFGLARNVYLMNRRAHRRWTNVHAVSQPLPDCPVPPEIEQLGSADEIGRCLANISSDQAEALLLHHQWGFTFDEIAGMQGITSAAARARASRGMADLRRALTSLRGVRV
jgi:RNA polymerase sigma-70 factor (ECF subfamily)